MQEQSLSGDDDVGQYVTCQIDGEAFALPMESVLEIIRVPETVRVPLTSPALLGLANLRGAVLPVLDTRRLMALPEASRTDASRVVVADCGRPVGLLVDRVERVISVNRANIEPADRVRSAIQADLLCGVVRGGDSGELLQLLDVDRLVGGEFQAMLARATMEQAGASGGGGHSARVERGGDAVVDEGRQLVSFMADGEEYALPIESVEEIVRVPADIRRVPSAERHVLGLMSLRNRLLPLVDLRRMFGLPDISRDERHRVLVTHLDENGETSVGIVVDEVRAVLRVPSHAVDAIPSLLRRKQLDEFIGVCRLDDGKRLVSILSPKALLQHPGVRAGLDAAADEHPEETTADSREEEAEMRTGPSVSEEEEQLVIFRLGGEEYGAALESVAEIIRIPEQLTRVPKTPSFIVGLVNLRGTVLPTLDMRTRFGLEKAPRTDRHRILVLELGGMRTGFIVDSVSEVLRVPASSVESPPHMSDEQGRIIPRVANLRADKRMILLLDVHMLLSDEEQQTLQAAA